MSQIAFGLLSYVFISIILASFFGGMAESGRADDWQELALSVISLFFLFTALTVVPMFHFNNILSFSLGELVTIQAGVIVFAMVTR